MTHQRRRFWLKLAAGLLFAVVAYGGAYAATVEPIRFVTLSSPTGRVGIVYQPAPQPYYPHRFSRRGGEELRPFFAVAHWADRKLRPEFWHD